MTIPPDVAERLEKLIPLLGSDNDGEALGAARAIESTLRAASLDFHALAASIRPRTVWRDAAFATPGFNYANEFRQGQPTGVRPDHPDALSPRFGLCHYTAERVESWMEVGRHCLELDRKIPKRHGGRFLREFELKIIRDIASGARTPTNAQASWFETVVARCHQARDAERRAGAA